jgi:nucleoside-diphosphate-sugar epimerase
MRMRVAVTGGSGKIGSAVVSELSAHGHEVINLDQRPPAQLAPGVRFVEVDLASRQAVRPVLEQVEAVCHLGEVPNVHVGPTPEAVYGGNARAGAVVLQLAGELKLQRVISTSSCQVYGMWEHPRAVPLQLPFDETHPVHPHNAYAAGKAANEMYAQMIAEMFGTPVVVFRLPWVLPANWTYSEEHVESLRKKPPATDGFATYLHTRDAARAYRLAIESSHPGFEIYHFCADEILSLYPLRERLREHHPDYPPLPENWPAFKSPMLTTKARQQLGWRPEFNFLDYYRQKHGEPR